MHLAEWEQAVEWCEKSIATNANYWNPHVDLVSANGWLHRDADARQAIDEAPQTEARIYRAVLGEHEMVGRPDFPA